jgi:hypothetical protein
VKISFYKRKRAAGILSSWVANRRASITQNRRVDPIISRCVGTVRERSHP